jgi:hypothetical protein
LSAPNNDDDNDDPQKNSANTRRLILSRRAKFVAAALATVACGKSGGSGNGCAGPMACLEPPIVATPFDADASSSADASRSAEEAGMMFDINDAGVPDAAKTAQKPDGGDAGPRTARDGGGAASKIKPNPLPCLNVLFNDDDDDQKP